jgi:hypothetical protein
LEDFALRKLENNIRKGTFTKIASIPHEVSRLQCDCDTIRQQQYELRIDKKTPFHRKQELIEQLE